MILADFHCICESMDNHAELTHGEEVLAARESGMCAKEILRLLGEVPEGPCELNLTGGPNDLLTRLGLKALGLILFLIFPVFVQPMWLAWLEYGLDMASTLF